MNSILFPILIAAFVTVVGCNNAEGGCYQESNHLPDDVYPIHYDIKMKPDFEAQTYDVELEIEIKVDSSKKSRSQTIKKLLLCNQKESKPELRKNIIVLHADQAIDIKNIEIVGKSNSVVSTCRDALRQLLEIRLAKDLKSGITFKLKINFTNRIRDDMRGFYKIEAGKYSGDTDMYASQLVGSDVRLFMPGFDEPKFRAPVSLTVRAPDRYQVVSSSNIESKHKIVTKLDDGNDLIEYDWVFKRSHSIPLGSFAFALGWMYSYVAYTESNVEVSIISDSSPLANSDYSLNVLSKAVEWMETYTGVPYPGNKFDLLALSLHNKGNTGSWSLATVKDELVLLEKHVDPRNTIAAALNVAQVVAHQWFGNIVSMDQWNALWVTEGLSTFLAYKMIGELYKDYPVAPLVRQNSMTKSMQWDSTGEYRLLSPEDIETAADIDAIHGTFTKAKGAALMSMISTLLGEDKFKQGISDFVRAHNFETASEDDFLATMDNIGGDQMVTQALASWLKRSGFPLVNVDKLSDRKFALYQEPYHQSAPSVDRSAARSFENLWVIPVTILFCDGKANSFYEQVIIPSDNEEVVVDAPEWFDLSQSGHFMQVNPKGDILTFYRVRYSNELIKSLQKQIAKYRPHITVVNLLDDYTQMAMDGKIPMDVFGDLIQVEHSKSDGNDMIAWLAATELLADDQKASGEPEDVPFRPLYDQVDFKQKDGRMSDLIATVMVQLRLIRAGYEPAIDRGRRAFRSYKNLVINNLVQILYDAAAKSNDQASKDRLLASLKEALSYDEKLNRAKALALTTDSDHLTGLLDFMKECDCIRPDAALAIVDQIRSTETGRKVLDNYVDMVDKWKKAPKPAISSGLRGEGNF